jgi:DNA-binding beta-propeller fold protein YncE
VRLPILLKNQSFQPAPPQPSATWTTQAAAPTSTPTPTQTTAPAFAGAYSLPGGPSSLAIDASAQRLYVARDEAQDVSAHMLADFAWITNKPLAGGVAAVDVNPNLGRVYASYGDPTHVLLTDGLQAAGQLAEGAYDPAALAVNPSNGRVYVTDRAVFVGQQDKVVAYDGPSNAWLANVNLGTSQYFERISVAVNQATGWAYAAYSGDDKVAVIKPDHTIDRRITPSTFAAYPWDPWMAVNSTTRRLYLRGATKTVVISLDTHAEVGTLDQAGLIAVDEGRNRVYVQRTSKVHVYDGSNNQKLRTIDLPDSVIYCTDIAFDPVHNRVLLAAPSDDKIVSLQD